MCCTHTHSRVDTRQSFEITVATLRTHTHRIPHTAIHVPVRERVDCSNILNPIMIWLTLYVYEHIGNCFHSSIHTRAFRFHLGRTCTPAHVRLHACTTRHSTHPWHHTTVSGTACNRGRSAQRPASAATAAAASAATAAIKPRVQCAIEYTATAKRPGRREATSLKPLAYHYSECARKHMLYVSNFAFTGAAHI